MRGIVSLSSRATAYSVAALLFAATLAGWAVQDATLDARVRGDLIARSRAMADAFQSDVGARFGLFSAVLNLVASFDARYGTKQAAALVDRNQLYQGLDAVIVIADRVGNGTFVGARGTGPLYVGDLPYYKTALRQAHDSVMIGRAVFGPIDGSLAIPFARSVRGAGGRPAGVISAVIPIASLTEHNPSDDIGPNGTLNIIDIDNGMVLARYTAHGQSAGHFVDLRLLSMIRDTGSGAEWHVSRIDGVKRAFGYRALRQFHIAVIVGLAYADAAPLLAKERRVNAIVPLAICCFLLFGLVVWLRQIAVWERLRALHRQNEEARSEAVAANRAKSEFLANMSHEIRTPLNGVVGLSYLMLETELTAQQRDYLVKITAAAQSLLGIINDVLDFSKIEAGKMELNEEPFDLNAVLNNVMAISAAQATLKGLDLRLIVDADVPTMLVGDAMRVSQVLTNIVGNAIKFTERGEVVLTVSASSGDDRPAIVRFVLRDTGIGMNEEQLARLFNAFVQADNSISRRFGGTGLGLVITKTFIDLMKGTIAVSSAPNIGTTFRIALPFVEAPPGSVVRAQFSNPAPTAGGSPPLDGLRLLVAEDNAINREIIVTILQRAGAYVECVENGRLAVERLAGAVDFDCVLMDVQMPELDGLAATRLIRERYDALALPVIALTAHAMQQERQRCLAAGMNDHAAKPIDPPALFATVRRWCRREPLSANERIDPPPSLAERLSHYDVAAAYARCGGDEAFLERMVVRFAVEFAPAARAIRAACASAAWSHVEILAHTLCSVAANVGAEAVSAGARAIEHALRDGDRDDLDAQIDHLEASLRAACEEAANLAPGHPARRTRDTHPAPAVEPSELRRALAELGTLIRQQNLRARRALDAVRPALDDGPVASQATLLAEQLDRLDFAPAGETLREIVVRLA